MRPALALAVLLVLPHAPARALDEPYTWRDPDSGCAYLLTRAGGITLKHRRDGAPDCPEAGRTLPLLSDRSVEQMGQGVEALKRELERLGERMRR